MMDSFPSSAWGPEKESFLQYMNMCVEEEVWVYMPLPLLVPAAKVDWQKLAKKGENFHVKLIVL